MSGPSAPLDLEARAGLFSIAKRTHRPRRCSPKGEARDQQDADGWTLRAKGEFCKRMVLAAVDREDVEEAVERFEKICSEDLDPDSKCFNAVVTLLAQQGDLERAEAWFRKPSEPALHPELANVAADAGNYIAMVVLCAERGEIPRAEKYANEAQAAGLRLDLRSYQAIVQACLLASEPRRAHAWASTMLAAGCKKFNKALMTSLVKALADTNNAQSADYWLTSMAEMGQRLDIDTYSYVRSLHPMEIVPSGLSGEGFRPRPPETRPATVGNRGQTLPGWWNRPSSRRRQTQIFRGR